MIIAVLPEARRYYGPMLENMHRDRKTVFVDQQGWDLPVVDGQFERDQFDGENAVYLVDSEGPGAHHVGSVRLLPTDRPHLLNTVFPALCPGGAPESPKVWEITRLCFAPHLRGAERQKALQRITLSVVEFGLLWGVERYLCMAYASFLSQILAMGWDCEPLCLPQRVDAGEPVGVLSLSVTPAILQVFRRQWDCPASVIAFEPAAVAA